MGNKDNEGQCVCPSDRETRENGNKQKKDYVGRRDSSKKRPIDKTTTRSNIEYGM